MNQMNKTQNLPKITQTSFSYSESGNTEVAPGALRISVSIEKLGQKDAANLEKTLRTIIEDFVAGRGNFILPF